MYNGCGPQTMQVQSGYSSGVGKGEDTVRFPFWKLQGILTGATGRSGESQAEPSGGLWDTFMRAVGLTVAALIVLGSRDPWNPVKSLKHLCGRRLSKTWAHDLEERECSKIWTTHPTNDGPRSGSANYRPQAKSSLCLCLGSPQVKSGFYIFLMVGGEKI